MSGPHVGELAALATALLWTLSALAWTAAGKHVGAVAVGLIRLLVAAALIIVYSRIVRGLWLPSDADANTWLILGASGFFGYFLSDLCMLKAFLLIGPRRALLIGSLTPPMAAVFAWVWIGDRLTWSDWVAMGVTLSGVVWVMLEAPSVEEHPSARQHRARGFALAALSSVAMAVGFVLSKQGIGD
jgi:drug/metabolite transporter (DMT)-like permease